MIAVARNLMLPKARSLQEVSKSASKESVGKVGRATRSFSDHG